MSTHVRYYENQVEGVMYAKNSQILLFSAWKISAKVVVAQASLEQQILLEISSEEQKDLSEDVLVLVEGPPGLRHDR